VISERAITALRCGAAVLHCTSGVRLRLSHNGDPIFEIAQPPCPEVDHPVIPTCRFRASVVRAFAEQSAGRDIAMCGLPDSADPQISYGVGPGDRVLPAGILRLERGGLWLHVGAIPGHGSLIDGLMASDEGVELQTLVDLELDVTIACAVCPAGDDGESAAALDAMTDLMGRVAVVELESYLATNRPAWPK
jgi:hypothetical protein